ncbi:MAG: hypothetical protein R2706_07660 [Acidimicrobiales bacterium]
MLESTSFDSTGKGEDRVSNNVVTVTYQKQETEQASLLIGEFRPASFYARHGKRAFDLVATTLTV